MTDANTICHDVDLLGDWLDAKGYTEEAGLCLRVLGLIHEQAEENEKLRAALKPFADIAPKYDPPEGDDDQPLYDTRYFPTIGMIRAAATALKENDNA